MADDDRNEEHDNLTATNSFTDPAGVSHTGELADLADTGTSTGGKLDYLEVADDYSSSLAGIQSAVDALPSAGGTVWVPVQGGPYPADSDVLSVPDSVRILSNGAEITAGTKDVAGGDTEVIVNADQTNGNANIHLEGFTLTGKINFAASGGSNTDITMRNVECIDVPDFAFDLDDLDGYLIENCTVDNAGAGTDNNGNDGIHLTDCEDGTVRDCQLDTGDDMVAIESNGGVCAGNRVEGIRGSSSIGEIVKIYVHPDTGSGDDIRDCQIRDSRSTSVNAAIEFELDGSGIAEDLTFENVHTTDTTRGIIVDGTSGASAAQNVTLRSVTIKRVQQMFVNQTGPGWTFEDCTFEDAGLSGSNYDGVVLAGDDCVITNCDLGPTTQHTVTVSADECVVVNNDISALGPSYVAENADLGIRVNGEGTRVDKNTIRADQSFAIGSSGTDDRSMITNNRTPNNNIGGDQFTAGTLFRDNIALVSRDLAALSDANKRDGQTYRHDGSTTITANGNSTSSPGTYVWSASDSEWKTGVAY